MAPRNTGDDSLMFLYKCLQATNAKIDFNILAAATGSTIGAARKRYERLRDKLGAGADIGVPVNVQKTAPVKPQPSLIPKSTVPQKRKAPAPKSPSKAPAQKESTSESEVSQQEYLTDIKRETRGKKIDYTLSGLDGADSDADGNYCSDFDSDGDFQIEDDNADGNPNSDISGASEDDIVDPPSKRVDNKQVQLKMATSKGGPRPVIRKSISAVEQQPRPPKVAAPKKKSPISKPAIAQRHVPVNSRLHHSDQPMPSIETSPSQSVILTHSEELIESEDDDIDIKVLQPGTILSFERKSGAEASKPSTKHSFTSAASFVSAASSRDSVGAVLQMELREHAQEVSPEDSVSMANQRGFAHTYGSVTPPGQTTFQRFKGLLSPWKAD